MTSLYVDRRGVELGLDGEALVFHEHGERVGTVPLAAVSRIFLRGDVTLNSSLLGKIGEKGIGVVVLSGRKAQPTLLLGRPHNDAARRIAQYRLSQDASFRLYVTKALVAKKIGAQARFLRERSETRMDVHYELSRAASMLENALQQIAEKDGIAQLRGLEGAAASTYFSAFAAMVPESLHFSGRNRRPPRDPVNAVLSLTYTMLHAEAVLAAYGAGLDPYIGFYHELDFGRESLASDLIEPLRAEADAFALRLFNRQELRAENFSSTQEGCFLGKAGRETYYRAYEAFSETVRKSIDGEIRDLIGKIQPGSEPCPTI